MKKESGLTLIEILVVVGIFSGLVSLIGGIFLVNFELQRKTMTVQKSMGEISYAIEYIGRAARMAKNDDEEKCLKENDSQGYTFGQPINDSGFRFIDYNEKCIEFFLEDGKVKKSIIDEHGNPIETHNLTSEIFEVLSFNAITSNIPGDLQLHKKQPAVTITLEIETDKKKDGTSWWESNIQTTITRRSLDIERVYD